MITKQLFRQDKVQKPDILQDRTRAFVWNNEIFLAISTLANTCSPHAVVEDSRSIRSCLESCTETPSSISRCLTCYASICAYVLSGPQNGLAISPAGSSSAIQGQRQPCLSAGLLGASLKRSCAFSSSLSRRDYDSGRKIGKHLGVTPANIIHFLAS